jgi:hypothetical protein
MQNDLHAHIKSFSMQAAQPQVSEIWGVLDDSEEGVRMSRGVTNKVFMPNQLAIGTALVGGGGPPGVPGGGGGGAGGAAGGRGALAGFVFDFGANTRKVRVLRGVTIIIGDSRNLSLGHVLMPSGLKVVKQACARDDV